MKCTLIITDEHQEEVVIYARERTKLTDDIEALVIGSVPELIGYKENQTVKLSSDSVYCFTVEDNKVYALTDSEKLQIKLRLYQLEEILPDTFVKINQSCIANIRKIERFDTSISGTLLIKFKNGYKDYVSRRQMKAVKERFGL
jgi:DNA-binding LytR/AlgR family response regulator